ncbi:hypothetical protein COV19_04855 [Candidatus Woesearchaeota archaeon CG10_big_fil_rev_8_21_14_0_10_44_13]|nr:MAG: hypothetical protein COV19_04855 [Candidatus Woesearchaeota archaeon CG10_big_fil_rev_8_21_14_0_10_44_13]
MEKLEGILRRTNVMRFNNSGTPAAVVIPMGVNAVYGIGGVSEFEGDVANFNACNGFIAEMEGITDGKEEEMEESIKAAAKVEGLYIHSIYFQSNPQHNGGPKIIVPFHSGFLTYKYDEVLAAQLNEEGYKIKTLGEKWQSR